MLKPFALSLEANVFQLHFTRLQAALNNYLSKMLLYVNTFSLNL
jgi:hypothetical protein